mmetsp:Transcript_7680/g.16614  ORF Transcript_7680/g.16614 Transcript_7680/m.16614 type:complete len:222 (+) Transcript_7680:165-830(+)
MTNVEMKRSQELQFSETERRASARLLSDFDPSSDGDADFDDNAPQKTLVIYSGPTSMNRVQDKNGMYIDNMNYFLEHGISCSDDTASNIQSEEDDNTESIIVNYAFVLTQEVADYYSAPNGPLTKKIQECKGVGKEDQVEEDGETTSTFIKVITRQDRCYDMEVSLKFTFFSYSSCVFFSRHLWPVRCVVNFNISDASSGATTCRLISQKIHSPSEQLSQL